MMLAAFVLVQLLLAALLITPSLLGHHFGIWAGLLGAVVGIPVWIYLGPRAMPGFTSGIIKLLGFAALIVSLIVWIVRVIRHVIT